jgi:hypothetical protein
MKYTVKYQFFPKGTDRPLDQGTAVEIEVDEKGFSLIPNVGDYVRLDGVESRKHAHFSGKVKSRLFVYTTPAFMVDDRCHINIVVEETDQIIWGQLINPPIA